MDGPDRDAPPPTPRWVKVSGVIALLVVLVIVVLHLTGNSLGGPGSHGGHGTGAQPGQRP